MANEKRLIDANAIPYELTYAPYGDKEWEYHKAYIVERDVIDAQPTVDAVEVVHGRWDTIWYGTDSRGNVVKCSVCGYRKFDTTDNYCPNCGAKMDGDGNE